MSEKLTLYYADRQISVGFFAAWKEMFSDIMQSRELIWRLFLRDFRAKYKQSLLGISWAIIMPLITVGVFVYLNKSGILNIGDTGMPYVVFALIGISIFSLFSSGLTACANSIVSAGGMVGKINFPKISLVCAAFGQALAEFTVRLGLLAIVFILFGIVPTWKAILLPLVLIPLVLFTLGFGLILALMTGVLRDIPNIISIGTMFFMFLTPVLYPISSASLLSTWNPLSHFIVSSRELILRGYITNLEGLLWASLFSIFVLMVTWRLFYLAETKIAERI